MLISVVIPAFNCESFLAQAVSSVLAQTIQDFEIIIVDDGSTDQTLPLARQLAQGDPRITVLTQPNSGGPASPRNRAIDASKGEIVAFLDPDDFWYDGKLETQMAVLHDHPSVDLVFDDADLVGADGMPRDATYVGRAGYMEKAEPHLDSVGNRTYVARESFFAFTATGPVGPLTSGVLVRRSALDRQPEWFPLDLPLSEDNDLWYRLICDGSAAFVNKSLHAYRQHADSLTSDRRRVLLSQPLAHARNYGRSAARLTSDERRLYRHRIGNLYFDLGYQLARSGEKASARSAYRESLRWHKAFKTMVAYVKTCLPLRRTTSVPAPMQRRI